VIAMTWFKVDDGMAFHHKIVAAGNAAVGLWARAGAFCAAQLTDGYVPDHMARQLGTQQQAQRLVEVGLWVREGKGFRFHEWNDDGRQPTRHEIETRRAADRERKQTARAARKDSSAARVRSDSEGTPAGLRDDADRTPHARARTPDPTRPVVVAEVVDQRPVAAHARNNDRSHVTTSSGFAADELARSADVQAGIEAIMRKLDCDEAWAHKTARRFDALAAHAINDHAAFYGKCISEHVSKHGLDSLLPTPIPKAPLLCEHGVPMSARCPDCEGTA